MKTELIVGVAQMTSIDSVAENVKQISKLVRSVSEPCSFVLFPENCLYFRLEKKQQLPQISFESEHIKALQRLSDETQQRLMLGGVPWVSEKSSSKVKNSIVLIAPNKKPQVYYSKIHLFDVDVPGAPPVRESEVFDGGERPCILEVDGFLIGLSICYDLRFSYLYDIYARLEVDAVVVPSAFLVPTGLAHWHTLLKSRAIENQCYVLAAAQSGEHKSANGSRMTYGHTLAVGPWGDVLCDLGNQAPKVEVITLKKEEINKVRSQIPMKNHRKQMALADILRVSL